MPNPKEGEPKDAGKSTSSSQYPFITDGSESDFGGLPEEVVLAWQRRIEEEAAEQKKKQNGA